MKNFSEHLFLENTSGGCIWKEIINTNVNIESNKQIRENAEKDVMTKQKVILNVSENCENAPLEKILENDKTNFKCNFENDLKFLLTSC